LDQQDEYGDEQVYGDEREDFQQDEEYQESPEEKIRAMINEIIEIYNDSGS